jgi:hypothetical protein
MPDTRQIATFSGPLAGPGDFEPCIRGYSRAVGD